MRSTNPHWGQRTRDASARDLLAEIASFRLACEHPDLRSQAQLLIDSLRFSELTPTSAESALAALESRQADADTTAHTCDAIATPPQPSQPQEQAQVAPNDPTIRALQALKTTLTRRLRSTRSPHRISYFTRRLTAANFALLKAQVAPKPSQQIQIIS